MVAQVLGIFSKLNRIGKIWTTLRDCPQFANTTPQTHSPATTYI